MGFTLEVVMPERLLFHGEVDRIRISGWEGQLGILPRHTPFITLLADGELYVQQGDEDLYFAIHGGFMKVLHDHVVVLADVAERAEEIDVARAEAARAHAVRLLAKGLPAPRRRTAQGALLRSRVRLQVAQHRHRAVSLRRRAGT